MRTHVLALALPAILTVAACGEAPAPEPTPSATPTVAAPRMLVAADFDPAMFGAKIDGPQGPEPEAAIMADGREIARIKSFVACPTNVLTCVPGDLPDGTIFTYVHEVTPALDETSGPAAAAAQETVAASGAAAEVPAALFRMTRAGDGFNRAVGYARAQAQAALGATDAIQVSVDSGQIIWRVTGGSGWKPGLPITFWWQSTVPPAGPLDAFSLELNGKTASVRGPFPPAKE